MQVQILHNTSLRLSARQRRNGSTYAHAVGSAGLLQAASGARGNLNDYNVAHCFCVPIYDLIYDVVASRYTLTISLGQMASPFS